MTGLLNFPELHHYSQIPDAVKAGNVSKIDPRWFNRSIGERRLAELIPECWKYDPAERIDVSTMVLRLRAAIEEQRKSSKTPVG